MARRKTEPGDKAGATPSPSPAAPLIPLAPLAPSPASQRTDNADDVAAREPAGRGSQKKAPPVARVLIVAKDSNLRSRLADVLQDRTVVCDCVGTLTQAVGALTSQEYEAAVVDLKLPDGCGLDVVRRINLEAGHTKVVLRADEPSLEDAVSAMRVGAVDMLVAPLVEADLVAGVTAAIELARGERERSRRVDRLKRICRRLNSARQQVTSQVDVLCNDLVGAYRELADRVSQVSLASEFGSIIQQELDVESLLRSALEYLLTKTGPTNAAVFLPSNHSDFNLGAYVNYDCPRDTADVLLDHLADVIAPRFQDETEIVRFEDESELAACIGDDASWLSDSRVIVFACRHEGECLAVVTLFRDQATPFLEDLIPQLKVMSDLFAKQLAKIIRIHHRHSPNGKEWSGFDAWEDEDDSGNGGIAA